MDIFKQCASPKNLSYFSNNVRGKIFEDLVHNKFGTNFKA